MSTVSHTPFLVTDSDPRIDLKALYLHALPSTPHPFSISSHLCFTTPKYVLPSQAEPFSIHCFSNSLLFTLSANHILPLPIKSYLQIPSTLLSLMSPNIPFTCLLPCSFLFFVSHLLPAIIQFCSFSSCFYCMLYLYFIQISNLQEAQHQNELKFSDKEDPAEVQKFRDKMPVQYFYNIRMMAYHTQKVSWNDVYIKLNWERG